MAVDGLDLSLGTGVHGLLGPNGAGKTTLIRALATVLRPAGGRLKLLGESVNGRFDLRGLRRRIGYLPQEFGYYSRFTVREFVEYMAWLKEMPSRGRPRGGAARHRPGRVGRPRRRPDEDPVRRHGAPRRHRPGHRQRPDGPAARRAHRRPGPGPAAGVPRAAAGAGRRHLRGRLHPSGRGRRRRLHRRGALRRGPAGLPGPAGRPGRRRRRRRRSGADLAADSPAERGYSAILRRHRERIGAQS